MASVLSPHPGVMCPRIGLTAGCTVSASCVLMYTLSLLSRCNVNITVKFHTWASMVCQGTSLDSIHSRLDSTSFFVAHTILGLLLADKRWSTAQSACIAYHHRVVLPGRASAGTHGSLYILKCTIMQYIYPCAVHTKWPIRTACTHVFLHMGTCHNL